MAYRELVQRSVELDVLWVTLPAFSTFKGHFFLSKSNYILKDRMMAVGTRAGPAATPDPGSWASGAQAWWAGFWV